MNSSSVGVFDSFTANGNDAILLKIGSSYCGGTSYRVLEFRNHKMKIADYSMSDFNELEVAFSDPAFVSPNNLLERLEDIFDNEISLVGFSFESTPDYYDDMDETEVMQTVLLFDGLKYIEITIGKDIDYYAKNVDRLELPFIHIKEYTDYSDTKFYKMENDLFKGLAFKLYKPTDCDKIVPYIMSRGDIVYASNDPDLSCYLEVKTENPIGISLGIIKLIFMSEKDVYTFRTGIVYDDEESYKYLAERRYR